jgi:2-oxoglutarate dehydrogenase E1 component
MVKKVESEEFGPNTWLVEELYRQYLTDPESVSETWRDFFEDYQPTTVRGDGQAREPETPPPAPAPQPEPQPPQPVPQPEPAPPKSDEGEPLTGAAKVIAQRMEESLGVPTATSVRTIPAKLLEINREILNRHLQRHGGGKVSFTHIIAYAVTRILAQMPGMNVTYTNEGGKPQAIKHDHVNLGIAVDTKQKDDKRTLLVPNIKDADTMSFSEFHRAYEDLIARTLANKLSPDDFAGTTATITNPGMIGTVESIPRLMAGQAVIVGVGGLAFPAEFAGADPRALAELGVGKIMSLTSTYDHRVIQGAESGEFLAGVDQALRGSETFYERIFRSMSVPYVPVQWRQDEHPATQDRLSEAERHMKLRQLIQMYRVRGHLIAAIDPLEERQFYMHPELDPASYGFTIWDLDRTFATGGFGGVREMRLRDILAILRDAYCRTSTVEYMHIQEPDQKQWIQDHVESQDTTLSHDDKLRILSKLGEVEALEQFLHTKYVGHRRYSLEGGDSAIPMLDAILSAATEAEMPEVVIGMSHRGRLDVLTAIAGKGFSEIFQEFEGIIPTDMPQGSGDVKYHLGAEGKFEAPSGAQLQVTIASNPSHLEAVDPVIEGMTRAKQDQLNGDAAGFGRVLPIQLHGDAAFAGQGVVAETLAMSQLAGFDNGGTVHVIVNNQLGFTTGSNYARSSTYASDVAKTVQAPIWHVNGDDPEACVRVARLAFEFRQQFQKDVVIDMWCYRKWGHNEGDEPAYTQPLMYRKIRELRSIRKRYVETLVNRGDLSLEEAEQALEEFKARLQQAHDETPRDPQKQPPHPVTQEKPEQQETTPPKTAVPQETLQKVLDAITQTPEGFRLHPKLEKQLEQKRESLRQDAVDWATAEALAFGSLILEGRAVRLSGQDSRRGTFSQRHSVLVDQESGEEYTPLAHLAEETKGGARFEIYDSLLSEFAVLGFEYGYSVADKDALVLWEAQFGDFANGAQVVIDTFIAAGEDKWAQQSGLVQLLPHGYEGQGPEHSSARLERFLQLSAEHNWQIVVPSTPAQYFHVLRRQALAEVKKPLVVFTPKSLLRLKETFSPASDLTEGAFQPVIEDPSPPKKVERVVLSQGKFSWDLAKAREDKPIALVRVEEPYPFPAKELQGALGKWKDAEVVWAQEEPENMGSWPFMERELRKLGLEPKAVTREESASPATGSLTLHQDEQGALVALKSRESHA